MTLSNISGGISPTHLWDRWTLCGRYGYSFWVVPMSGWGKGGRAVTDDFGTLVPVPGTGAV